MRDSATSPSQRTPRSVKSSKTRARAGVRLVNSRGAALRHTREGDEKDIRDRARVEDVIHFATSLDERLPRAVRAGLALAANRSVNGERASLYDHDRARGLRTAKFSGRTWDRTRLRADSLGRTEGHSSPSLQRKRSSARGDDDPSLTTAFHPAFGQQVDMAESDDDAPLGSA
jgi:hypothetical protein